MSRSRFNRAAENIAYGHADFASTLKQWTNSAGHRANLVLHGAKWIGVAHAQNGRRMYWAMVIGGEMKDHAALKISKEGKTEDRKIRACLLGPPGEGRQQGERGRRRKGKIVEPSR
jgi:hypothetical protein